MQTLWMILFLCVYYLDDVTNTPQDSREKRSPQDYWWHIQAQNQNDKVTIGNSRNYQYQQVVEIVQQPVKTVNEYIEENNNAATNERNYGTIENVEPVINNDSNPRIQIEFLDSRSGSDLSSIKVNTDLSKNTALNNEWGQPVPSRYDDQYLLPLNTNSDKRREPSSPDATDNRYLTPSHDMPQTWDRSSTHDRDPQPHDRGPPPHDRDSQTYEKGPPPQERDRQPYDRGPPPPPYDRGPPPHDRGPPPPPPPPRYDWGPPPRDRGPPPHDRGPPPHDRGPPPHERGPPPHDRGPPPRWDYPPHDRGPPPRDRWPPPPPHDHRPPHERWHDHGPPHHGMWHSHPPHGGWHRQWPSHAWWHPYPEYYSLDNEYDWGPPDRRPPPPPDRRPEDGWGRPPPHRGPPPPPPPRYDERPPPPPPHDWDRPPHHGPPPPPGHGPHDRGPPDRRPPPDHGPPDDRPPNHRPPPREDRPRPPYNSRPYDDHKNLYDDRRESYNYENRPHYSSPDNTQGTSSNQNTPHHVDNNFDKQPILNQSIIEAIFGSNPSLNDQLSNLVNNNKGVPLTLDTHNSNNQVAVTKPRQYLFQAVPVTPES